LPAQLAPSVTEWLYEKRIVERLPSIASDAPSYEFIRDTGGRTGAAAIVGEGQPKPEIVFAPDAIVMPMLKIAAHMGVSWEVISDHDRYLSYLQRTLPLEIINTENQQVLYGSGIDELQGFATTPGILTKNVAFADDVTALDAIEEAITDMREQPGVFAVPSLLITSPSSFSALRRIKDLYGRYYLSPDPSAGQGNSLWGVPVLTTTVCAPGDGFLIDTNLFGAVIVREGLVVRQGLSDDDFVRNIVRFISEERLNVACERPKAVLRLLNLPTTAQSS
jgi:HK97 family phage major capsid protein